MDPTPVASAAEAGRQERPQSRRAAHAQSRRPDDGDAEHRPVHPDVPGRAEPGRTARRDLPAARSDRHRQDAHRRSAGRGAARQRQEGRQDRLRRVPVRSRSRQADRRASGLSRAPRDAAGADAGEALGVDLGRLPALDRAVRRDREGRAGALDAAARHPRSRHADARRQHRRQLRAEPDLPDEQPRRARDDEGDAPRPRLPGRGRSQRRSSSPAKLESIGVAAVRRRFSPEFVNRIDVVITYQPLDEHGARGDSRSAHRRSAAAREHAARQPLVRDRGVARTRSSSCSSAARARSTARAS